MRIFWRILVGQTERMKIRVAANTTSSRHHVFDRSIRCLSPRAIAIQALCMGIALFDFPGAIMGLSDFVIAFWNQHPLLTIICMAAAILLFAGLVEFGIESLRVDRLTQRSES
jgi:hypothetical protein